MFRAVFSALKRAFDLSLAPILIAALGYILEKFVAGVSWTIVQVADFFVSVLASMLNAIPMPDIDITGTLSVGLLKILDAIGFWPAVGIVLLGGIVRMIIKVATVGIVSK